MSKASESRHAISLAEWLADELRERILDGRLPDGTLLAKQDEIAHEFRVSKPSTREAFRILETEGLITVRRGRLGGSIVHVPNPDRVAYMLALILQTARVGLGDVGFAIRHIEPICASLCAEREDRKRRVVPALNRANESLAAAIASGGTAAAIESSRSFHEALVASCGNDTMIAIAGSLEAIWSAHEQAWVSEMVLRGEFPPVPARQGALEEHERLTELIDEGEADEAAAVARAHLESAQLYPLSGNETRKVDAALLRFRANAEPE
jgi:GntR family transcriptional regulator, transcriptional repressor for pyruvate dehydrogenase complex